MAKPKEHPLLGRAVRIEWHDEDSDWENYQVIGYHDGWILLRGRPDDDGSPFRGGDFMVPMSSIDTIVVAEE